MVTTHSLGLSLAKWVRISIPVVAIMGLMWIWLSRPGHEAMNSGSATMATVGAPAPALALKTLTGNTVSPQMMRGKVAVINFWATWCPPCRAEMAALERNQQNLSDRGLVVLGVNQMEDAQVVAAFMLEQGLTFPIALDTSGEVSRAYRVQALPTTYFVDRNGAIRDVVYGGPMSQALIESKVLPLLAEPAVE